MIACAQNLLPGNEYPVDYPFSKADDQYPVGEYCFVGLISLEDPPKHGVREAIGTLRLAGIKVMMVTGQFSGTLLFRFPITNTLIYRRPPQNCGSHRSQDQPYTWRYP